MGLTRFQRGAASAWLQAGSRLRNADWLAIAADIAIVVLGILIAFQLDRWSEQWRAASNERHYLERLDEESTANIVSLEQLGAEFERNTDEVLGIFRMIASPSPKRPTVPPDYGCGMLHLPATRLRTLYLDLADGAAIDLGRDQPLRQALRTAAAERSFAERQLDYFRDTFQRRGNNLDRYTVWSVDPRTGAYSCRLALDALADDQSAVSELARVYRDRRQFAKVRARMIDAQKAVRARVHCLRRHSCA